MNDRIKDITWKRSDYCYYLPAGEGYQPGMINEVQIESVGDRFRAWYTDGYSLQLIGFFGELSAAIDACETCILTGSLPPYRQDGPKREASYGCHFTDRRVCVRI